MRGVIKYAAINSIGTALYISAVASFIYFLGNVFDNVKSESIIIPISMLMLFVFSAAFTGILVFGRPITWYLNGKKRESLFLIVYTLGFLLILTIIAFFLLVLLIG